MSEFVSRQPDIHLPRRIAIWDWVFDPELSPSSPFNNYPVEQHGGYEDATTKERLNWSQVRDVSTYISTALQKDYGYKEGETMSLFSRNTIWYPVMMFSAIRVGGKVSGASPAYNVEEMTYALKTADAKFLATSPTSMDVAIEAAKNAGIPKKHIFLLEGQMEGFTTIKELVEIGKKHGSDQAASFKIPKGKTNFDVCAFLSFSSGTTGLPKAVMIAHQNVIAQTLQIQQITPPTQKQVLAVLPLFHITGLVHGMHLPLIINASVIMLPSFTMEAMLKTISDYKIAELLLVPPIIIRLVRDEIVKNYDLSHVRRFSSGAAPLSEEIIQQMEQRFPGTGFKQGYGMTESCSCISAHPPDKFSYKYAHSVGTIVASTKVRILKEDGTLGGFNEPGEILARGPQIVMGYLNNEKATKENFDQDGYLHTGDQGMIDEEGILHITDRLKEMIKVKGIAVAPAELEDHLLGHDMVEDVAVLGMLDDYSGELPKAFIVLKKGVEQSEEVGREILKYVQDKKVKYKWVKEVEFISEIPKSASGKILRRILRDLERSGKRGFVVRLPQKELAKL